MITDYFFLSNRISNLEKQIEVLMERLDKVQCNMTDWEEGEICNGPPPQPLFQTQPSIREG